MCQHLAVESAQGWGTSLTNNNVPLEQGRGGGGGEGVVGKPGAKTGGYAGQEPLRQVHGVGHPYHCQPAALPHWPLKQVVQHLQAPIQASCY